MLLARAVTRGAIGAGSAGNAGFAKAAVPPRRPLTRERHWEPMRGFGSGSRSRPMLQPMWLSEPSMRAEDSSPGVAAAIALKVADPGAFPPAAAALPRNRTSWGPASAIDTSHGGAEQASVPGIPSSIVECPLPGRQRPGRSHYRGLQTGPMGVTHRLAARNLAAPAGRATLRPGVDPSRGSQNGLRVARSMAMLPSSPWPRGASQTSAAHSQPVTLPSVTRLAVVQSGGATAHTAPVALA